MPKKYSPQIMSDCPISPLETIMGKLGENIIAASDTAPFLEVGHEVRVAETRQDHYRAPLAERFEYQTLQIMLTCVMC